ncbi:MAG TPA: dihydrofolate reductase [bacterium]|nr:dihydrofolate reductase [bacterium]
MINIIAVVAKNLAIGKNNQLLWHLPDDLKHFKEITQNHPVLMGLNTYYSIGKPLANRINVVVSKDKIEIPNCEVFTSLEMAIDFALSKDKEIFIIGGASIYEQTIKTADKLYLTIVDCEVTDADAFFPDYSEFKNIIKQENFETDDFKYSFVELIK